MVELTLDNLKINFGAKKKRKRVGRGNASGHGTYSGRGLKGQRARSGGKKGLKLRGLKQLLKNKPKIGGFKSQKGKFVIINLDQLEKNFSANEIVNPAKIIAKGLTLEIKNGIKILGQGKLTKKLNVLANAFSESAKKAIMEVGGQAQLVSNKLLRNNK